MGESCLGPWDAEMVRTVGAGGVKGGTLGLLTQAWCSLKLLVRRWGQGFLVVLVKTACSPCRGTGSSLGQGARAHICHN